MTELLAPRLDQDAVLPLYRQLYLALRAAILDGRLRHRLPSTRRLAKDLGISRNSVATAFDLLAAEGYLTGRRGSGSFVADSLPDPPPATIESNTLVGLPDGHRLSRRSMELPMPEVTALPDAPFSTNNPRAFADFPWGEWSRLMARPWRRPTASLITHHHPAGLPDLRRAIAEMLGATRAMRCDAEQILVTGGSQQALDIASRLLIDPQDRVMVEDPGFAGIDAALLAAGGQVLRQPVDREGLQIPRDLAGIKAVVVTPSRNFPLGTILSLPRRLALLQAAARAGCWIIEDDFDAEFRLEGRPLAALFGLDRLGQVLYAGTFSRTLFPSIRLGYLVVPPALIEPARAIRAALDGGVGAPVQAALIDFIREGHYGAHLRRQRLRLAESRRVLTRLLTAELADQLEIVPSDGGLSLTVLFRADRDDVQVVTRLASKAVAARPLSSFYRGGTARHGLVLGFAGWSDEALGLAVKMLALVLAEKMSCHDRGATLVSSSRDGVAMGLDQADPGPA